MAGFGWAVINILLQVLHNGEYLLGSEFGGLREIYLLVVILNVEVAAIVSSQVVVEHLEVNLQELRRVLLLYDCVCWLLVVFVVVALL